MLEERVRFIPALGFEFLDPICEMVVAIFFAPYMHVSPRRGADEIRAREVVRVGNTQRTGIRAEVVEHLVVEPTLVPEFDRGAHPAIHKTQEGFKTCKILLEIGRQLK